MDQNEALRRMAQGEPALAGSPAHQVMHDLAQEALRLTMELNSRYHTPEEVRELFSQMIGKPVDDSFNMFPPFHTDCGKNITVGKNVFINACCCFQDQRHCHRGWNPDRSQRGAGHHQPRFSA